MYVGEAQVSDFNNCPEKNLIYSANFVDDLNTDLFAGVGTVWSKPEQGSISCPPEYLDHCIKALTTERWNVCSSKKIFEIKHTFQNKSMVCCYVEHIIKLFPIDGKFYVSCNFVHSFEIQMIIYCLLPFIQSSHNLNVLPVI